MSQNLQYTTEMLVRDYPDFVVKLEEVIASAREHKDGKGQSPTVDLKLTEIVWELNEKPEVLKVIGDYVKNCLGPDFQAELHPEKGITISKKASVPQK